MEYTVTLKADVPSDNSVTLGGRRYAVITDKEEELSVVLDTLNVLYPAAVTSSRPLSGRVSKSEARLVPLSWAQQDDLYLPDLRRRIAEAYLSRPEGNPEEFKTFWLDDRLKQYCIDNFEGCVDAAFAAKDAASLARVLANMPEHVLVAFVHTCDLEVSTHQDPIDQFTFSVESLQELKEHVHNPAVGFSGVIVLQDAKGIHTMTSEGMDPNVPFAIHSIGKVFTGMLTLRLIHERLIAETVLDEPIQLDPLVIEKLPPSVQAHLKEQKPTLRQVMLHQGGFDEYLDKYFDAIEQALESGIEPPQMTRPEDFLTYAENKTVPMGETHYSNLGLLLVGLSLQHLTGTPFDTLLEKHVLEPSGINHFSSKKPREARVSQKDPLAAHVAGSPAGGYWTTATDLCQFGKWIASQWTDPTFVKLVEEYGSEFYSQGQIWHDGVIPSSSACLSSFPKYGITIAILSDKNPGAPEMDRAIRAHMLHRKFKVTSV